jgi:hypothetical protein
VKLEGVLRRAPPDPLTRVNCLTCLFTSRRHSPQSATQYARRSAHYTTIAGRTDPNTGVDYRRHADVLALLAEGGQSVHKGRGLKLLRRIAETVTRGLNLTAG